ncbi:hypothetical protein TRFO_08337 [Tritrichomonas foetus]|uniref:Protein kinase domain-containing protein n=1 Tax=Tritrichomonas foetus TaxID=1144522 RepID=A0A1J4JKN3_9EUKA|nr:hypothetical protein TRFO_08337 [Tritrichomonas foetus]|eukprot:OHS99688.1 hypothetical protein TRFO_08337 [Tritrichomonas foetus]
MKIHSLFPNCPDCEYTVTINFEEPSTFSKTYLNPKKDSNFIKHENSIFKIDSPFIIHAEKREFYLPRFSTFDFFLNNYKKSFVNEFKQKICWILEIANALNDVHTAGQYIGFLSPQAFFVDHNYNLQLGNIQSTMPYHSPYSSPKSLKPDYSQEHFQQEDIERFQKEDIYSFGLILLELFYDVNLKKYDRSSLNKHLNKIINEIDQRTQFYYFTNLIKYCCSENLHQRPNSTNLLSEIKNLMILHDDLGYFIDEIDPKYREPQMSLFYPNNISELPPNYYSLIPNQIILSTLESFRNFTPKSSRIEFQDIENISDIPMEYYFEDNKFQLDFTNVHISKELEEEFQKNVHEVLARFRSRIHFFTLHDFFYNRSFQYKSHSDEKMFWLLSMAYDLKKFHEKSICIEDYSLDSIFVSFRVDYPQIVLSICPFSASYDQKVKLTQTLRRFEYPSIEERKRNDLTYFWFWATSILSDFDENEYKKLYTKFPEINFESKNEFCKSKVLSQLFEICYSETGTIDDIINFLENNPIGSNMTHVKEDCKIVEDIETIDGVTMFRLLTKSDIQSESILKCINYSKIDLHQLCYQYLKGFYKYSFVKSYQNNEMYKYLFLAKTYNYIFNIHIEAIEEEEEHDEEENEFDEYEFNDISPYFIDHSFIQSQIDILNNIDVMREAILADPNYIQRMIMSAAHNVKELRGNHITTVEADITGLTKWLAISLLTMYESNFTSDITHVIKLIINEEDNSVTIEDIIEYCQINKITTTRVRNNEIRLTYYPK